MKFNFLLHYNRTNNVPTYCPLSSLPDELLEIILSFLTNHFTGIVKFGTLNRHCKYIADHSRLWFTCDLSFSCPRTYSHLYSGFVGVDPRTSHFLLNEGLNPQRFKLSHNSYHIVLDRVSLTSLTDIENPLVHQHENHNQMSQRDEALLYRKATMKAFLRINRIWSSSTIWITRIRVWRNWINNLINPWEGETHGLRGHSRWLLILALNLILPSLACYFLSDLSDTPSSLTATHHLGFLCWYFFVLLFLMLLLVQFFFSFSNRVIYHKIGEDLFEIMNFQKHLTSIENWPFPELSLLMFAMLLSSMLLHYKLNTNSSSFPYIYVGIPFLVSTFLISTSTYRMRKERSLDFENVFLFHVLLLVFVWSLALTTLLLCLYNADHNNHNQIPSLSIAIIPFYLFEFFICVLTIISILLTFLTIKENIGDIWNRYNDFSSTMEHLKTKKWLFFSSILRSCLLLFMFVLLIVFNDFIIKQKMTLAIALIGAIIWIACIPLVFQACMLEISASG